MKMTDEHKRRMQEGRMKARSNAKKQTKSTLESNLCPQAVSRYGSMPPRFRKNYAKAMRGRSLRAAVDAFCNECMGWEMRPRDCTAPACPLYAYRPGKKT